MIQYLFSYRYPKGLNAEIDFKKDKEDKKWKREYFSTSHEYNKMMKGTENTQKNIKEVDIKRKVQIASNHTIGLISQGILTDLDPSNIPHIHIIINKLEDEFEKTKEEIYLDLKKERIEIKEGIKFSIIKCLMLGKDNYKLIKHHKYCKREEMVLQYKMSILYQLYDLLEVGGSFIIGFMNICNIESINYIYLLSLLFERIIIIEGTFIHCFGYLGDKGFSREKFKTLSNKKFYIHPKPGIEKMVNYIQKQIENRIYINNLIQKHKYEKYIEESMNQLLNGYMETSLDSKKIKIILDNFLLYFKIQRTPQWIVDFMKEVRKEEVQSLISLIDDKRIVKRVLKVGMSYGMYEEVFLEVFPHLQIKILSKEENNYWEKVGMDYLESKGYKENIELYSEDIFYALPKILQNYGEGSMDIIFIEEVFSIDRMIYLWMHFGLLIRLYGLIIFDKMVNPILYNFFDFIEKNYPLFKKIELNSGLVIYRKNERFALDMKIESF